MRISDWSSDVCSSDLSPRAGLIYKPAEPVSIYASYSRSFLPRAGEQLASLSLTNQALDPESFTNYEAGAKWDLRPDMSSTIAFASSHRSNVGVSEPEEPSRGGVLGGTSRHGGDRNGERAKSRGTQR